MLQRIAFWVWLLLCGIIIFAVVFMLDRTSTYLFSAAKPVIVVILDTLLRVITIAGGLFGALIGWILLCDRYFRG